MMLNSKKILSLISIRDLHFFKIHYRKLEEQYNLNKNTNILYINRNPIKSYALFEEQQKKYKEYLNNIQYNKYMLQITLKNKRIASSGLMLFTEEELILIKKNSVIVKGMLQIILKNLYGYNKNDCNIDTLYHKIGIKSSFKEIEITSLPKDFTELFNEKKIAAMMKFVDTYNKAGRYFPKNILKYNGKILNIDALPNFIEGYCLREMFCIYNILRKLDMRNNTSIQGFIVNPDNLNATPMFTVEQSNIQTGQKHADVIVEFKYSDGSFSIKLFDEKSVSTKPFGRILYLTYCSENIEKLVQFINSTKGVLTNYTKQYPSKIAFVKEYFIKLNQITTDLKYNNKNNLKNDLINYLKTYLDILYDITVDTNLKTLNVSLYEIANKDNDFIQMYTTSIDKILENITNGLTENEIEEIFIRTPFVRPAFFENLSLRMLHELSTQSEVMRKVLQNYEQFIRDYPITC